jgi:hypothetical protein
LRLLTDSDDPQPPLAPDQPSLEAALKEVRIGSRRCFRRAL